MFAAVSLVITQTGKQPKCPFSHHVQGHLCYRMLQGHKEEHITDTRNYVDESKTHYT